MKIPTQEGYVFIPYVLINDDSLSIGCRGFLMRLFGSSQDPVESMFTIEQFLDSISDYKDSKHHRKYLQEAVDNKVLILNELGHYEFRIKGFND